jgi:peptidoglycan hydrolase-like amidase
VKGALAPIVSILIPLLACTVHREPVDLDRLLPETLGHEVSPVGRPSAPPRIRVKLAEGKEFRIELRDSFVVYRTGRPIAKGSDAVLKLSLLTSRAARLEYFALISQKETRLEAVLRAEELRDGGTPAVVKSAGRVYHIGKTELDNRKYLVLAGPYATESEAQHARIEGSNGVVRSPVTPPEGALKIAWGAGKDSITADPPLRIVPRGTTESPVALVDSNGERRMYNNVLEVRISSGGDLLLINELSLEEYLRGVIPHEMGPAFPLEALKAQAVAARSFTLAYLDLKPSLFHEPYDFTADVFSQVFGGAGGHSTRADSAVRLTEGQVLIRGGELVRGFYHSSCGGHTESSTIITGDSCCFLEGTSDLISGGLPDLGSEEGVRLFLDGRPNAYSGYPDFPSQLAWLERSYRWEVTLTAEEIEDAIALRTGHRIGDMISLTPLERGVSGRISRMEVRGTRSTVILPNQLEIRQALSKRPLKSSLFYLGIEPGADGRPGRVTFVGGGFGHGVGLCQTGATAMALLGKHHCEILLHYYRGCSIVDLY